MLGSHMDLLLHQWNIKVYHTWSQTLWWSKAKYLMAIWSQNTRNQDLDGPNHRNWYSGTDTKTLRMESSIRLRTSTLQLILFSSVCVCVCVCVCVWGRRFHCLLLHCNVCAVHFCWWCHWQDMFCKCLFLTVIIIIDILLFICTWKFIQGYVTWISGTRYIGTRESVHFMWSLVKQIVSNYFIR